MIDLLFSAGQALSAIGLAYGGYLCLSYRDRRDDAREVRGRTPLLHHLTTA